MRRPATLIAIIALFSVVQNLPAQAVLLSEGFDVVAGGIPTTTPGWFNFNHSDSPDPAFTYGQGNPTVFPSQSGAPTSYISCSYQSTNGTTGTEQISNWLLTPQLAIQNGTVINFFARSLDSGFPDRLQIRLSTAGASTDVGTTSNDVGVFTTLMLDINPTLQNGVFLNQWTQFNLTVSGVPTPTTGRFAFRYFVQNSGPFGPNGDYIGIDTLTVTGVPEPTSLALVGVALAGGVIRRRRAAKV